MPSDLDYIKNKFINAALPVPDEETLFKIKQMAYQYAIISGQSDNFDKFVRLIIDLSRPLPKDIAGFIMGVPIKIGEIVEKHNDKQ